MKVAHTLEDLERLRSPEPEWAPMRFLESPDVIESICLAWILMEL